MVASTRIGAPCAVRPASGTSTLRNPCRAASSPSLAFAVAGIAPSSGGARLDRTTAAGTRRSSLSVGAKGRSATRLNASGGAPAMPDKKPWVQVQRILLEQGLETVSAEEAIKLTGVGSKSGGLFGKKGGTLLIDVRPAPDFEKYHAAGSINVPLVQDIEALSVKKLLFMAQAVRPIEDNPDFAAQLVEASASADVIFCCGPGGTTTATQSFPAGQASRSLLACYAALASNLVDGKVLHLQGGLNNWFASGGPGEGDEMAYELPNTPRVRD